MGATYESIKPFLPRAAQLAARYIGAGLMSLAGMVGYVPETGDFEATSMSLALFAASALAFGVDLLVHRVLFKPTEPK